MQKHGKLRKFLLVLAFIAFIVAISIVYLLITNKLFRQAATSSNEISADAKNTELSYTSVSPAPDITVVDGNDKTVKLSELKGKPVVINMWATWCPYCDAEMQDFEQAYQDYGEEVQFMMINLTDGNTETRELADAFIVENNITCPVYYDTEGDAVKTLNIYSIPQTFFIDSDGNMMAKVNGMTKYTTIVRGIKLITAEKKY